MTAQVDHSADLRPDDRSRARVAPQGPPRRGRLFVKYVLSFIGLVTVALAVSGALDVWFSYGEAKDALVRIQQEKAESAARRIAQFVEEIERQIGWTTHAQWGAGSVEIRRFDYVRLLRQVPAITELVQLDGDGKEQLKVSRLAMDVVGSGADYSRDAKFTEAVAHKIWFSPVYFRKESEPYMTIALARAGRNAGVTVAEVNLKLIWDVITGIKVGKAGYAYVVGPEGHLIAHPDISLVLRNTDLAGLPQVAAARAALADKSARSDPVSIAPNYEGGRVLTAYAPITPLSWLVFVELPIAEAQQPLYASLERTGALLLLGLIVATVAGILLARRMIVPIRTLQDGAARLGGGELGHRIELRTKDEIETLAGEFNRMAAQLQEFYAGLERKVEERTRDLTEALEQQTATAEVLRVIGGSPGDLAPVFKAMLENATRICEAGSGVLWLREGELFRAAATHGLPAALTDFFSRGPHRPGAALAQSLREKRFVQIADIRLSPGYGERNPINVAAVEMGGVRSLLTVPMMQGDTLLGNFSLYRQEVRPFTEKQIMLVKTFADQAVIAIENVRLLNELRARTADLARSVEELKTLSEVGQAVSSTLDVEKVLETVVTHAVELSGADACVIFRYRKSDRQFRLHTSRGLSDELIAAIRGVRIKEEETAAMGRAIRERAPVQTPDLSATPNFPLRDLAYAAGFRAVLIVPLVGPNRVFGALVVQRKAPGEFPPTTVDLLQTFASQSALAIQNARLFREVEEQGRQLAIASQHKSQFLANMSHELRTPLNAILGYTELLVDGIYGELSDKARGVLDRVQSNGRHLLKLINDVLDLSKIEAGQLDLALEEYSMAAVVKSVVAAAESLAQNKGLAFGANLAEGMPLGRGDERRLTQVLLNLVGNAIKFTDEGSVEISASVVGSAFVVTVRDTGPGVAEADQKRIFEEFQQVDNTSTRKKGGTGLGLAISKRIVEMHGGELSVESAPGSGSTFRLVVPVRVEEQMEAAQ